MKKINKIVFVFLLLVFVQCKKDNVKSDEFVKITDVLGREVQIPKNVTKIVGIGAGSLRFISYLDALSYVVGVEDKEHVATRPYNFAFPEIKKIPIIGPQSGGGDAELIMKANPQVIFMTVNSSSQITKTENVQNKTGIPVIAIENGELGIENDKLFNTITIMGKVLSKEERAKELITFLKEEMNELKARTKNILNKYKPTTYIAGLSYNGPHGITSTRTEFSPFVLTNSKNVVSGLNNSGLKNRPIMLDVEKLIEWNPEYIFIDSKGWEMIKKDIEKGTILYNTLSAVKNGKVYIIPRYINNQISYDYALIGSWYIAKVLYPEEFKDINIEEKSKQILETFYAKKISLSNFDLVFGNVNNQKLK